MQDARRGTGPYARDCRVKSIHHLVISATNGRTRRRGYASTPCTDYTLSDGTDNSQKDASQHTKEEVKQNEELQLTRMPSLITTPPQSVGPSDSSPSLHPDLFHQRASDWPQKVVLRARLVVHVPQLSARLQVQQLVPRRQLLRLGERLQTPRVRNNPGPVRINVAAINCRPASSSSPVAEREARNVRFDNRSPEWKRKSAEQSGLWLLDSGGF